MDKKLTWVSITFRLLLALFFLLALSAAFVAYLRPDFMVDVANQVFALCGW